jgi:hypothetical protein
MFTFRQKSHYDPYGQSIGTENIITHIWQPQYWKKYRTQIIFYLGGRESLIETYQVVTLIQKYISTNFKYHIFTFQRKISDNPRSQDIVTENIMTLVWQFETRTLTELKEPYKFFIWIGVIVI